MLDVRLRGLSGLEFQSELIKSSIEFPIIFISGHGDIPMTVRAIKAGAIEFLTKPFRDQDLLDAVQLGHREGPRPASRGGRHRRAAGALQLSDGRASARSWRWWLPGG